MRETTKAMKRRTHELGSFPWNKVFFGHGLDVGCGDDRLVGAKGFDKEDGDANHLSEYFPHDSFDYIHASQCLEHMDDPRHAVSDWLRCLKIGGYLVVTVPDWCLYEKMTWPSRFNSDHKSTWSMWHPGAESPIHIYVPTFLHEFRWCTNIKLCRVVDTNYDYTQPPSVDQTQGEAEAFIEFVLQKDSTLIP